MGWWGRKPEEEIDRQLQAALPEATAKAAAHLLERLKARADEMLADRRRIRRGFLKRQREKWGKPLDQLFMLLEAAREAGEEYNESFEAIAAAEQDYVFDALRRCMHGPAWSPAKFSGSWKADIHREQWPAGGRCTRSQSSGVLSGRKDKRLPRNIYFIMSSIRSKRRRISRSVAARLATSRFPLRSSPDAGGP